MKITKSLCTLETGEYAVIKGISPHDGERRRLRELGFNDGVGVECVLRRKGMSAYLVNGLVIAIRDRDCENIQVSGRKYPSPGEKRRCMAWR